MALSYLNIRHEYNSLLRLLDIRPDLGTEFSAIHSLSRIGVRVHQRQRGHAGMLYRLLAAGWPVIAAVQTRELAYWTGVESQHTVTIIGMTAEHILVNDPAFAEHPLPVSYGDFDLAWLEMNESYAVITPVAKRVNN